jgi:hypothetical protein
MHVAVPSLEILGHTISAIGSTPKDNHAAEIKPCPPPQNITQQQRFLGMVNFYHQFLPNCVQVLHPLTDLLKGGPKCWSGPTPAQEAFQNEKCLLATAVPLKHPAPQAELSLVTDASNIHISGIMQQKSGDHWRHWFFLPKID